MEENTHAISSPPTTSNHDNNAKMFTNSSKIREEGELSASENDEFEGSQFADSTVLSGAPLNKDANVVKTGTSAVTHNPTSAAVTLRTSVHLNNRKGTEKNRVPFVISFSDDDSGSDSEEYRKLNTIASDDVATGIMENKRPTTPFGNSQVAQQTAKNNIKIHNKLSTNRTFVSSTNKANVKTHLKKSNPPSKIKFGQNVHINSSKLQDLRQLIAIRENELKNKVELKNNANMNSKSNGNRSRDSTERVLVEPNEPESKRLKVSEPSRNGVISVGQHDRLTLKSTLTPEISLLESDGLKGRCDGQSSEIQQIKEVKNHEIASTSLPSGSGIIRNSRRHNRITNLAESFAPSLAKTDETSPPVQQVSLNNSTPSNQFGATNTSETGNMDIKSLFEIEELQDKELDEAQEHRRKCEIEERNALKAYRKAQRALAEANNRCSYLYNKRELFSANLRSRVMEDSSMFWSNMPHQHTGANNMPHHQVLHEDGKNVVSESCGEPDSSGSEPQEEGNENNTLAEDEQTSAFELKAGDSSHGEEINNDEITPDPTEDSLLLEATLRSQLFARLGIRSSKKNKSGQSMEPVSVEREDGEILEDSGNIPSSETKKEKDQLHDFEDIARSEESLSSLSDPILRSAFGHVKFTAMMNSTQSHTDDISDAKKIIDGVCGDRPTDLVIADVSEVGSYSNNIPINPFWPLCMFELRGKCNDDECPLQHVRDYSSKSIDCNNNESTVSKSVAPPTYIVCLDSLKADSHPYKYLVAQTVEHRWQKHFSAALVVSSSIFADLHSDEPCLHGPETRIEVHGVWNRQSSYFHGKNVSEGLPDQQMDDTYQPLDIALFNLSREVNKQKGRREALIVIARALEEHPTSVLLWIVYLHIYYSNQKSIGKDDMFRYAIDNNESSYELWLMFINSREKLDDRLLAYNTAISALCRHASDPDRDPELDSDCILDLFLQMINCLCISGQIDNAIQKISTNSSNDLYPPFLPDLHSSLTIPNKFILSICCAYLVMYKKLPDSIVQQFECRKKSSLLSIEWRSVRLTEDEKMRAGGLMELSGKYLDNKSDILEKTVFAVNHVKCTAVVHGYDRCKILLEKYIRLYPTCLELVLLSIRVNGVDSTHETYTAFEEAINNWVGESGVQCVWNQYAENALRNQNFDFAKKIMERWSGSISEIHNKTEKNVTDDVFVLLNLSLHKQLQNDHTEARITIEKVLEASSSDDYNHCVKEHAMFFLKNGIVFEKARLHDFLKNLNRYLTDSRIPIPSEPLSRSFLKTIEKPKTRKLVNNLLSPVSSDSFILNSVLESCFGPTLLPPHDSEKLTDFVDFAESLMEIRPANYRFAMELCKNRSDANSTVSFWASEQVINSLFQAVPVAPESVWVEAAGLLKDVAGFKSTLESFHKRALSVYPFSTGLWKSYIALYDNNNNNNNDDDNRNEANEVIEMAREKGIKV